MWKFTVCDKDLLQPAKSDRTCFQQIHCWKENYIPSRDAFSVQSYAFIKGTENLEEEIRSKLHHSVLLEKNFFEIVYLLSSQKNRKNMEVCLDKDLLLRQERQNVFSFIAESGEFFRHFSFVFNFHKN
ncbi:hypothetical protein CEXT_638911 [Caerostris extrusa]|uniref:Uncharacterized protein n=1 Tax=Caerostris extrusa TaxID=172846 RepID=A0AAV4R3U1_CAEEX|nr:hypothetical protein CEXT_638911 [Caerostris extrusa]